MSKLQYAIHAFVFSLLMIGCAPQEKKHVAVFAVNEDLVHFVRTFEQDAQGKGINLRIDDLILDFGSTPNLNETGVCEIAQGETPKITINPRLWAGLSEDDREEVIYHELGHCVFRRGHQNGEVMGYNGAYAIPASVMYPYRIPGHVYRSNEAHYHSELFDTRKFNQF